MRFKTRRSWTIALPAFVLLVGVLALGLQASSSPFASNLPAVPEGTARVIPGTTAAVKPTSNTIVPMDQWRYTQGSTPTPSSPSTVPTTYFQF
jgi:hypothetical protein